MKGNVDGRRDEGRGSVDGTTSRGDINSTRVDAALLAGEANQQERPSTKAEYNSPVVSTGPSIQPDTGSSDIDGDAEESKSHLQMPLSVGRWRSKPTTYTPWTWQRIATDAELPKAIHNAG